MKQFYVSPYPSRPATPWKLTVPQSVAGVRIRRFFRTEAEAWAEGPKLMETLRKGGTDALALAPQGMSMRAAVRDYVNTKAKKSDNHRQKIERVCGALIEAFPGAVAGVAPMAAARWFATIGGSPTTRAGWHRYASGFFAWCVDMEIIEKNPMRRVEAPRAESKRSLVTARELEALLDEEMSDGLRAWLLLGAFAGLRSIEVARMRWEDVDAKAGQIEVRREVSKQSSGLPERIVDFTEPLKKRAAFFNKKGGRIVPEESLRLYRERSKLVERLNAAGKVPWAKFPENALRHSYATYHLARGQDAQKTAHQLGHSTPAMVLRVYAVPARRADWKAWWRV